MNAKEECLKLYRHEKSSFIPFPLRHMNLLVLHELERGCGRRDPEGIYEDCFGVKWFLHSTGAIPVQKEHRLADITRFREESAIPTDAQVDSFPWDDWISAAVQNPRWDTENNYTRIIVPSGFFERLHHLMGMEEALIALIEEAEAREIIHKACDLLAPTGCWIPNWDPNDTTQEQQVLFRKLYVEKLAEMGYSCE